ncbi:MAG: hydantoinase/oxoprolinase family protein [Anaerolineae bacterium]
MNLGIGIDTGGTYTDAVLLDMDSRVVLAQAKAETTKHRLATGIEQALRYVLPPSLEEICLVSLSTTLATNALVEGQGAPVCLLLLGYEHAARSGRSLEKEVGTSRYVYLPGGHDIDGQELSPLDLDATRAAILANAPDVRAFAISGYFGTRNPAHEIAVQALVTRLTGLPTTSGHDLTQDLDALRRAATAALNASLIPLISDLIEAVEQVLDKLGIGAPLMLVKGDGSLIRAEAARDRPIETVLSGPAASVVGAQYLGRSRDAVVVDMGGTTTDIAMVERGQPRLATSGARVGAWHTMVEAIDIQTVGLGGDSSVQFGPDGRLTIGPRRVIPLCMLAHHYPRVENELARLDRNPQSEPADTEFLTLVRANGRPAMPDAVGRLLRALENGPLSRQQVDEIIQFPGLHQPALAQLERLGVISRSAVTPTDAAHVLGWYTEWHVPASELAIRIWARSIGIAADTLAQAIVERTSTRLAQEIARKAWDEDSNGDHSAGVLPERVLERLVRPSHESRLCFRPLLDLPIVGLGAPANTYFPAAAALLGASVELPSLAHVANAVGAIVGSVVARSRATVVPAGGDQGYQVQSTRGVSEYLEFQEALDQARSQAQQEAVDTATAAGAADLRITVSESLSTAPVGHGYGGEVFISTCITAEAIGRPRLARG